MTYEICTYGHPVLKEKSKPVAAITPELREVAQNMLETMHGMEGLGLAAQQVGRVEALCVVDVPPDCDQDGNSEPMNPGLPMPLVLFNPEITEFSEKKASRDEGCLSFPEIYGNVTRPAEITVQFMDLQGKQQSLHLKGLTARAVQHELDHLNGVVFIERMSHVKKLALGGKLRRLARDTREHFGIETERKA